MLLLSRSFESELEFVTVTRRDEAPNHIRFVPLGKESSEMPPPTNEIALLYCNAAGNRRAEKNHWELLQYHMDSGAPLSQWPYRGQETETERQHRLSGLLDAAEIGITALYRDYRQRLENDAAVARQLQDSEDLVPAANLPPPRRAAAARNSSPATEPPKAANPPIDLRTGREDAPAAPAEPGGAALGTQPPAMNHGVRAPATPGRGATGAAPAQSAAHPNREREVTVEHSGLRSPPRGQRGKVDRLQRRISFSPTVNRAAEAPAATTAAAADTEDGVAVTVAAGRKGNWRNRTVSVLQQLNAASTPVFVGVVNSLLERFESGISSTKSRRQQAAVGA